MQVITCVNFGGRWGRVPQYITWDYTEWEILQHLTYTCSLVYDQNTQFLGLMVYQTRRPASADSTARRQFQFQFQYLFISRVHLFYDVQWKRISGFPFIVKSHNNTDNKSKCIFLNRVQVNLIYNTNRNLLLWIEIFICTADLYNATANRWSCHLPNRNV